jgi:hypothetical protein
MTRPLDIFKSCLKHDVYMVPNVFEPGASLPRGVEVFRCPNLSCSIFYATGALDGFYTRNSNGELSPFLKSGQQPQ